VQRKRKLGEERRATVELEVSQLTRAGFIREITYTTWLANVVMVKKSNSKWRLCVDYTDLNKAYPKDTYPLRSIDRLVDNMSGYEMLSFLDAYSGYNHIWVFPQNEDKTVFMTKRSNYCYQVMLFGLKNVGATYELLMDKKFHELLGKTMEVYVNDMVVKSVKVDQHAVDLEAVFSRVRRHEMRLNPEKCFFGIAGGKFLTFMITQRGIEANPDKCEAILGMRSPSCLREVQQLNGKLVVLSCFLPKLAEKAKSLFKLLKGAKALLWDDTCEHMFTQIKKDIFALPVLISSPPQAPLLVYLAMTQLTISSVLVYEEGRK